MLAEFSHSHKTDTVGELYSSCIGEPVFWSSKHASFITGTETENFGNRTDIDCTIYTSCVTGPWKELGPSGQVRSCAAEFVDLIFPAPLRPRRLDLHGRQNRESLVRVVGALTRNKELQGSFHVLWSRSGCSIPQDLLSSCRQQLQHFSSSSSSQQQQEYGILPDDASCKPQPPRPRTSRHFVIPLKDNRCVNWLRLEFDSTATSQVHELWQTTLIGVSTTDSEQGRGVRRIPVCAFMRATAGFRNALGFRAPGSTVSHCSVCALVQLNPQDTSGPGEDKAALAALTTPYGGRSLDSLPPETLLRILRHLPLPDLANVSCCSRVLRDLAGEALSRPDNGELSFRPHWDRLSDAFLLQHFANNERLRAHRLDLSWCGTFGRVSLRGVAPLLSGLGRNLRSLRMVASDLVNTELLNMVVSSCPNLSELDVSKCRHIHASGFQMLLEAAPRLELLFVAHTAIPHSFAQLLIERSPNLRHVDFSGCPIIPDELCQALGSFASHLQTVQLRFVPRLTTEGLRHLAWGCPLLTEIDVTQSFSDEHSADMAQLFSFWPHMRKLFFGGSRFLSPEALKGMSDCTQLEQLDISGATHYRFVPCLLANLLARCPNMRYLNISFISSFLLWDTAMLRSSFPHVHIQQDRNDAVRRQSPSEHQMANFCPMQPRGAAFQEPFVEEARRLVLSG